MSPKIRSAKIINVIAIEYLEDDGSLTTSLFSPDGIKIISINDTNQLVPINNERVNKIKADANTYAYQDSQDLIAGANHQRQNK